MLCPKKGRYVELIRLHILVNCMELRWRQPCSDPVAPCKLVKTNKKFYICSDGTHTHTHKPLVVQRVRNPSLLLQPLPPARIWLTCSLARSGPPLLCAVTCHSGRVTGAVLWPAAGSEESAADPLSTSLSSSPTSLC